MSLLTYIIKKMIKIMVGDYLRWVSIVSVKSKIKAKKKLAYPLGYPIFINLKI